MLRNSRKSVLSSFIASAALFAAAGLADAKNITIYQHEFTANSLTDIEAGYGYVPGSLVLTADDEGTPVDANGNTFNGANIGSAGYTAVLLVLSTAGYRGGANTGGSKINLQYFTPRASAYAASSSYGITGSFLQQWYVEQNKIGVISESA